MKIPLTFSIITAAAQLVDDSQSERREPAHSEIEFLIGRAGLLAGDPNSNGQLVGKAKRVRAVLTWGADNSSPGGTAFLQDLISLLRGRGGFRPDSSNYVGDEAIKNAQGAFRGEGFVLTADGELHSVVLSNLTGYELTEALNAYARRAIAGAEDAALLTGTGKDLLEATVAHVLTEVHGSYQTGWNFKDLLGHAFFTLGLASPAEPAQSGDSPQRRMHRAMFELAMAVNALRNKQGTGHGRPWPATVTEAEARAAIQTMGTIAEFLLRALSNRRH